MKKQTFKVKANVAIVAEVEVQARNQEHAEALALDLIYDSNHWGLNNVKITDVSEPANPWIEALPDYFDTFYQDYDAFGYNAGIEDETND